MQLRKNTVILTIAILLLAGLTAWFAWREQASQAAKPVRDPVHTVKLGRAEQRTVPITVYANGYVTPVNTVEVRPQVQNIVRAIHVREGQEVRAGDLLFTLDERSDRSAVRRAEAEAAATRADLADAESTLRRNQGLLEKGFVAPSVVENARNKVNALKGTLQAGQAATSASAIALGNNRITASIGGRIGLISVHVGSLAQPAAAAPMLTIAQLDPIAISFSVPERELANIAATYPKGDAPVTARIPGGQELQGRLVFIDNSADTQSGTIRMKAQFDNGERRLWPGSFVNVRLVSRTLPAAVVVPAQAVVTGPTETFVYVLQPDSTVEAKKVEVLAIEQGAAAVAGLAPGVRVVVEGAQNLRPGSRVREAQDGAAPALAEDAAKARRTP